MVEDKENKNIELLEIENVLKMLKNSNSGYISESGKGFLDGIAVSKKPLEMVAKYRLDEIMKELEDLRKYTNYNQEELKKELEGCKSDIEFYKNKSKFSFNLFKWFRGNK